MIVKPSYLVGGTFNAVAPTMQDGDVGPLQFDTSGNLKVNVVIGGGGSGSNAAAGPTGSPVPSSADYQGVNIGGTLTGVTGLALGATTKAPTVAIVDGNGNQIISFGGGTQYATGTAVPTPTGTASLGWDGTDVRVLSTDSAGQLKVLIQNTPAVTVSGNVNVTQGTSPWVISFNAPQHVIIDSGTTAVTQSTNPWIVAGAQTPADSYANPADAQDIFALNAGWDATNSKWQRLQVDAGTGTLKVDIGSSGTVAITGNVNVVGTTTDGTTTETNFLVVGGETNDVTAQYQPIPLGAGGRSVIVEGTAAAAATAVGNPVLVGGVDNGTLMHYLPIGRSGGSLPFAQDFVGIGGIDNTTGKGQLLPFRNGSIFTTFQVSTAGSVPDLLGFWPNGNGGLLPAVIAPYVYNVVTTNWDRLSNGGTAGTVGVGGAGAADAVASGNPVLIAGVDGSGIVQEIPVADFGTIAPSQSIVIGATFNSTQPVVASGSATQLQSTAAGALIVSTGVDGFNISSDSTPVPILLNMILAQLKLLNYNLASSMPSAYVDQDSSLIDTFPTN